MELENKTATINRESFLISICMPAFRAEKYLQETLDSIQKQSFENWELIVVEDGSKDNTEQIVQRFRTHVKQRVCYLRNDTSKGPGEARNLAMKNAKGEWIAFIDSDDLWHQDHLHGLIQTFLANPSCDLIHSDAEVFDSDTRKVLFSEPLSQDLLKEFPVSLFTHRYGFQPSQVMISKTIFIKTGGFDMSFRYAEDMEFWFRCAKNGFGFAFSEKKTCRYRKHRGALTTHSFDMALGTARVYDAYSDWSDIPKRIRLEYASTTWLSAGRMVRRHKRKLAKQYISSSIKHKMNIKNLLYWLLLRSPL